MERNSWGWVEYDLMNALINSLVEMDRVGDSEYVFLKTNGDDGAEADAVRLAHALYEYRRIKRALETD